MGLREDIEALFLRPMSEEVRTHLTHALDALGKNEFEPIPVGRTLPGFYRIPGYKSYAVDKQGQVCSIFRRKMLKPFRKNKSQGHLRVQIRGDDGRSQKVQVHQLVMWAFVGPTPPGALILHRDDDPENNHLDNLRFGTAQENKQDAMLNGRHKTSLSTEQEEHLVDDYQWVGLKQKELAEKYGISQTTVSRIIRRVTAATNVRSQEG